MTAVNSRHGAVQRPPSSSYHSPSRPLFSAPNWHMMRFRKCFLVHLLLSSMGSRYSALSSWVGLPSKDENIFKFLVSSRDLQSRELRLPATCSGSQPAIIFVIALSSVFGWIWGRNSAVCLPLLPRSFGLPCADDGINGNNKLCAILMRLLLQTLES